MRRSNGRVRRACAAAQHGGPSHAARFVIEFFLSAALLAPPVPQQSGVFSAVGAANCPSFCVGTFIASLDPNIAVPLLSLSRKKYQKIL